MADWDDEHTIKLSGDDVVVGRVLHEDDGYMTIQIVKDNSRMFPVHDGDRFFTMLFTHGIPWKDGRPGLEAKD